ncbi:MAG TPA: prolyl oligopeptidase family serine peptidase [Planctomycetota bacterium]|nr:prolyl oligopeptidase family serine peptidase [Planctomycetota bacterium]
MPSRIVFFPLRRPLMPIARRLLAVAALFAVAVVLSPAVVPAQEQESTPTGTLKAFLDADSKELATKLEVLQHAIYAVDQQLVQVSFRQQHGDRIAMHRVLYPNRDNDLTPGFVFTPKDPESRESKRPGLIMVHGGFHLSMDADFFPHIARAVEEGFVVMFPEYRGSRGYGAEHYNAQDYGGKDVDDVLAAADHLAARPEVDGSSLGILGISRGGMLTLLAIAREPKKFKAAVDIVGLTDFLAYMAYKPESRRRAIADLPRFGGLPHENFKPYLDVSPLTHVDKMETPLLILATTDDRIVPVELHTLRLIDALKARGKTFEAKIYERAPGGHGFFDGASPEARDAQDRVFRFLKRHLVK